MKFSSYKELAAGALIYNAKTNSVLLGRSPGKKSYNWTMFKGKLEDEEDFISAARRETLEECGIDVKTLKPILLGGSQISYDYIVGGDKLVRIFFYEFELKSENQSPSDYCKCTTFFESNGRNIPEIVEFRWIKFDDIQKYCFRSQKQTLEYARKILESKYISSNS